MSAGTDTTILASVKGLGEARTSGNVPIKQDDADEDTINEEYTLETVQSQDIVKHNHVMSRQQHRIGGATAASRVLGGARRLN